MTTQSAPARLPSLVHRTYSHTYWYDHSAHDDAKKPHIVANRNRVAEELSLRPVRRAPLSCIRVTGPSFAFDHVEWYKADYSLVMMCHEYDTRPESIAKHERAGFQVLPALYSDSCVSYAITADTPATMRRKLQRALGVLAAPAA